MRRLHLTLTAIALLACSACGASLERQSESGSAPRGSSQSSAPPAAGAARPEQASAVPKITDVSVVQTPAPAAEVGRKIIRNAELTVESDAPEEGLRKVASITESRGGFVVTTEVRQQGGSSESGGPKVVTVVARIPAEHFEATVEEFRKVGGRVLHEKRTGQDVTEEFIDLEARVRTKRALESQFLEIMKQTREVADALEVQKQLAGVRGEIEQLEGRRRFLENQSSLSTITITLEPPSSLVPTSTGGFIGGLRAAVADGLYVAMQIFLGLIRLFLALLPIFLFVGLPLVMLWRYLRRRARRRREAQQAAARLEKDQAA